MVKPQPIRVTWTNRPVRLIKWGPEQCEVQFTDTGVVQGVLTREVTMDDTPPLPTVDRDAPPVIKVDLSSILAGLDIVQVAKDNDVWKDQYSKLGPGQVRMTVGNALRGKMKKGVSIRIMDTVIEGDKK